MNFYEIVVTFKGWTDDLITKKIFFLFTYTYINKSDSNMNGDLNRSTFPLQRNLLER